MALTPEGKVKTQVKVALKRLGVYYFCPVTSGYGTSGAPDFIVCMHGRFIGIECKAKGNKMTRLQEQAAGKIRAAGGLHYEVNEWTIGTLLGALESMDKIWRAAKELDNDG